MHWSELATRTDLEALRSSVRGEIAEFRADVRIELTELRGEMSCAATCEAR